MSCLGANHTILFFYQCDIKEKLCHKYFLERTLFPIVLIKDAEFLYVFVKVKTILRVTKKETFYVIPVSRKRGSDSSKPV